MKYIYYCPVCGAVIAAEHEKPDAYQECTCKATMLSADMAEDEWDNKTIDEKLTIKSRLIEKSNRRMQYQLSDDIRMIRNIIIGLACLCGFSVLVWLITLARAASYIS